MSAAATAALVVGCANDMRPATSPVHCTQTAPGVAICTGGEVYER